MGGYKEAVRGSKASCHASQVGFVLNKSGSCYFSLCGLNGALEGLERCRSAARPCLG